MIENLKLIPGLDILKFLMALLIVAVHSEAFRDVYYINEAILPIINSAVPIFFVISSFLLFRKTQRYPPHKIKEGINVLKDFSLRLLKLYLFWFIVEFPIVIHARQYLSMSLESFILNLSMDIVLRSTFHGAWFLSALIVGCWIIYFVGKTLRNDIILIFITFVISYYSYHYNCFAPTFQNPWKWYNNMIMNPQNSFPVSLLWVTIGYILSKKDIYMRCIKINANIITGVLVVSYIITISGVDLRLLIVPSIVIIALKWQGNYRPIYKMMRQSSILIFFLHFIFISIFRVMYPTITWLQHGIVLYGLLILLSVLTSFFIIKASKTKYFSWLRYAY